MIEFIVYIVIPLFCLLLVITVFLHLLFRVPYVPSPMRAVRRMIKLAEIKQKDVVYDLGCGDGRLLFEAEKKGALAEGFEIAPLVYLLAIVCKLVARSKAKVHFKSMFSVKMHKADVIFCYLLPGALKKLAEKFQKECKKGTKIISHTFRIQGMEPVKILRKNRRLRLPTVYLYQI
ncbi:MAG: class I SAM-dependent methyltransferase [Patescibacteria group bacterium]